MVEHGRFVNICLGCLTQGPEELRFYAGAAGGLTPGCGRVAAFLGLGAEVGSPEALDAFAMAWNNEQPENELDPTTRELSLRWRQHQGNAALGALQENLKWPVQQLGDSWRQMLSEEGRPLWQARVGLHATVEPTLCQPTGAGSCGTHSSVCSNSSGKMAVILNTELPYSLTKEYDDQKRSLLYKFDPQRAAAPERLTLGGWIDAQFAMYMLEVSAAIVIMWSPLDGPWMLQLRYNEELVDAALAWLYKIESDMAQEKLTPEQAHDALLNEPGYQAFVAHWTQACAAYVRPERGNWRGVDLPDSTHIEFLAQPQYQHVEDAVMDAQPVFLENLGDVDADMKHKLWHLHPQADIYNQEQPQTNWIDCCSSLEFESQEEGSQGSGAGCGTEGEGEEQQTGEEVEQVQEEGEGWEEEGEEMSPEGDHVVVLQPKEPQLREVCAAEQLVQLSRPHHALVHAQPSVLQVAERAASAGQGMDDSLVEGPDHPLQRQWAEMCAMKCLEDVQVSDDDDDDDGDGDGDGMEEQQDEEGEEEGEGEGGGSTEITNKPRAWPLRIVMYPPPLEQMGLPSAEPSTPLSVRPTGPPHDPPLRNRSKRTRARCCEPFMESSADEGDITRGGARRPHFSQVSVHAAPEVVDLVSGPARTQLPKRARVSVDLVSGPPNASNQPNHISITAQRSPFQLQPIAAGCDALTHELPILTQVPPGSQEPRDGSFDPEHDLGRSKAAACTGPVALAAPSAGRCVSPAHAAPDAARLLTGTQPPCRNAAHRGKRKAGRPQRAVPTVPHPQGSQQSCPASQPPAPSEPIFLNCEPEPCQRVPAPSTQRSVEQEVSKQQRLEWRQDALRRERETADAQWRRQLMALRCALITCVEGLAAKGLGCTMLRRVSAKADLYDPLCALASLRSDVEGALYATELPPVIADLSCVEQAGKEGASTLVNDAISRMDELGRLNRLMAWEVLDKLRVELAERLNVQLPPRRMHAYLALSPGDKQLLNEQVVQQQRKICQAFFDQLQKLEAQTEADLAQVRQGAAQHEGGCQELHRVCQDTGTPMC